MSFAIASTNKLTNAKINHSQLFKNCKKKVRWGRARKKKKNKTILSKTKTLIAIMHMRPPKINIKGENPLWVSRFSVYIMLGITIIWGLFLYLSELASALFTDFLFTAIYRKDSK